MPNDASEETYMEGEESIFLNSKQISVITVHGVESQFACILHQGGGCYMMIFYTKFLCVIWLTSCFNDLAMNLSLYIC